MKLIKTALLIAFAMTMALPFGMSKPEYGKKEGKACTFCHVKVATPDAMHKDPNLTEAGKYYAAHNHSLDGYKGK